MSDKNPGEFSERNHGGNDGFERMMGRSGISQRLQKFLLEFIQIFFYKYVEVRYFHRDSTKNSFGDGFMNSFRDSITTPPGIPCNIPGVLSGNSYETRFDY